MNNEQLRTQILTYRPTVTAAPPAATYSLLPVTYSLIYSFSAKERDAETGLSYFGARYYSSDLSIWLSVDPMSGKYPHQSNYVYCSNNPIVLVDPNGEFDTRAEARQYRREHHTGGVIKKKTNEHDQFSGNYSIINKREGVGYTKPNYQKDELDPPILGQNADNVVRSPLITPQESGRGAGASVMSAAFLICGVLAEDDVTIVGITDDVAIPIVIASGAAIYGCIVLFKAHNTNVSKSNYQRHTARRSGGDPETGRYGKNQNDTKGDKNQKYIPKPNPNKRKKK